jgi:hypothetical protein
VAKISSFSKPLGYLESFISPDGPGKKEIKRQRAKIKNIFAF